MRDVILMTVFSFLTVGCLPETNPGLTTRNNIQSWARDSSYYSWNGEEPILLLGAGNDPRLYADPEYKQKLKLLAEAGGNLVAMRLDYERSKQSDYLDSLINFTEYASHMQIAVCSSPNEEWVYFDEHFLKTLVSIPNLLKSTGISPVPRTRAYAHWENAIIQRDIAKENNLKLTELFVRGYGETAAEGIAGFNRALLAGAAAVRHAERPYGEGFSGPALASIRAARTVERLIPFWELRPAMEIVPNAAANSVYAATDGKNGYVLYLPTAASVEVKLDVNPQVPLRVTVVGYLGTQKSEVLQPPYGERFVLSTEEPRGGWMVIKPF